MSQLSPQKTPRPRKRKPVIHYSQRKTRLDLKNLPISHSKPTPRDEDLSSFLEDSILTIENLDALQFWKEDQVLKAEESFQLQPFSLNMAKNSYELPAKSIQQVMWVQLVREFGRYAGSGTSPGGQGKPPSGVTTMEAVEAPTLHMGATERRNLFSPRSIPPVPLLSAPAYDTPQQSARSDALPLHRQRYNLILCANNRRQNIHRGNTKDYSSTISSTNSPTPQLHTCGILHILNKDDEGSLFFGVIPTTNGIHQTIASPFVVHSEFPHGYVCGSFHNQYKENELTPVYYFHFRHAHWMVMERQKFINRALTERTKLIERRYGHSMVYYRNNLYVFGGFQSKQQYDDASSERWMRSMGTFTNEIIRFDIKRQTWNRVIAYQQWSSVNVPRDLDNIGVDEDYVDKYEYLDNESTSSSLSGMLPPHLNSRLGGTRPAPMPLYTLHVTDKECPAPRIYHTATLFNSTMVIFGGLLDKDKCSNEVYAFDLLQRSWKLLWRSEQGVGGMFEMQDAAQHVPTPRKLHSACRHGDLLFIFGGLDQHKTALNDLFVFSLTTRRWSRIDYTVLDHSAGVAGRYGHASFMLPPMSSVVGEYIGGAKGADPIMETHEDPALIILGGYTQQKDPSLSQDGYIVRIPSALFAQNTKETLFMPMLDEFADVICVVQGEMFHLHICMLSQSRVLATEFAKRHHSRRDSKSGKPSEDKVVLDFSILAHHQIDSIFPHTFYHLMILMYGGYVSDLSNAEVSSLLAAAELLQMDEKLIAALQDVLSKRDDATTHVGMFLSGQDSMYHHLHSIFETFHGREMEFSDLVLRGTDGQIFPTHKYLLCSKFEYFCTVLKGRKREVREIPLLYSQRTLSIVHTSLYVREEELFDLLPLQETAQLFDLLEATHELMMNELHAMVMRRLCLSLSMDNFTHIIEWCRQRREILLHPKWIQNASTEFLKCLSSHERLELLMQDKMNGGGSAE